MPVEISPDAGSLTFDLVDRGHRLARVRLMDEIGLPGPLDFHRVPGGWRLVLPRPEVDRFEYLLELEDHNGRAVTIPDPGNQLRAGGAFGDKSVVEFPEYLPPEWLALQPAAGREQALDFDTRHLDFGVTGTLWTADGVEDERPAPMVLVHDGPEYDRLGSVTRYLAVLVARGDVPPLRVALLDPGDRNDWYAANPSYAAALAEDVVPGLPPASVRVGVGVSLGAVATLHAHRSHAGLFDALLLQSGSFFTPELDPQESGFDRFAEVSGFVAEIEAAVDDPGPVPCVLTCGTVEENLENNEAMARHLRRLGYPVSLFRVRDAHNYTAWRDTLDPHLGRLLETAVARAA